MAPWLCHVHLHDNLGEEDQHLPLGMGNIPMEAVLDTIIKFAPRASFTIENMHCEESVRWLTEKGYIRKENAK
jgi:sugar phosphate isomerase/epimerase